MLFELLDPGKLRLRFRPMGSCEYSSFRSPEFWLWPMLNGPLPKLSLIGVRELLLLMLAWKA